MTAAMQRLPDRVSDPYIAFRPPFPSVDLTSPNTALLVVDMQYGCVGENYGIIAAARAAGHPEQAEYFKTRLRNTTVPNIARLQAAFRAASRQVIYTHIVSLTPTGVDRSPVHKALGIHYRAGTDAARIVEGLAPLPGEIVLPKTSSSVFNSTNIHFVLSNVGIRNLVICGVVTTGCVETAVRDAADLGYHVVLAEDACAAVVEEMHWASVRALRDVYAQICDTSSVVEQVKATRR